MADNEMWTSGRDSGEQIKIVTKKTNNTFFSVVTATDIKQTITSILAILIIIKKHWYLGDHNNDNNNNK